mgnify:FL=1
MYLPKPPPVRKRQRWRTALLYVVAIMALLYAASRQVPWFADRSPTPTPTPSADYYLRVAEQARRAGDLDSALAAYDQALTLHPSDPDSLVAQAQILVLREKFAQAIDAAQKALALRPNSSTALAAIAQALD